MCGERDIIIMQYIIIIRNIYIAPNPTRLAQSTSQFKTRMNITVKACNMHTPDDPMPTAKCRQTCTHLGTVNAVKTCNAATQGPWTHLMIWIKCKDHYSIYKHKNWSSLRNIGIYWKSKIWNRMTAIEMESIGNQYLLELFQCVIIVMYSRPNVYLYASTSSWVISPEVTPNGFLRKQVSRKA